MGLRIALVEKVWSSSGGTERYTCGLARHLALLGHEVHVICARQDPRAPLAEGVSLHPVGWLRPGPTLKALSFDLTSHRRIRALGARRPFDVVMSLCRTRRQDLWRAGGGCYAWYTRHVRPQEGRRPFGLIEDAALGWLERRSVAATPAILAVSRRTAAELAQVYPGAVGRIHVLHNPVDAEVFHPGLVTSRAATRGALGIPEAARVALLVGSGWRRKGLEPLLRAAALLRAQAMPLHVVAVGADRSHPRWRRLAEALEVPLHLPGEQLDVGAFYGAADVFCLPSCYDPCSNATLEALACGLPVVTTRLNGASEVMEGRGAGRMVEHAADTHGLSEALAECLEPSGRQRMSEAARRVACGQSWAGHVGALLPLLLAAGGRRLDPEG